MPKSKTDVKVSEEPNVTEEEIDKTFQIYFYAKKKKPGSSASQISL